MKPTATALVLLAGLACGVARAGPYDQPWVVITSDHLSSADPNLRPVVVNRVDGETSQRNQVITTPGPRMVTVDLPPRPGFKVGTQETFDLEASPCMRYFLAAKLDAAAGQQWKAVVRRSELIGDCATKFKSGALPK